MTYKISVIGKNGEVIHTSSSDEHPSEDYLRDLARRSGGVYCDVCRLEPTECTL